jgi:release factor glutamine methyltransferase
LRIAVDPGVFVPRQRTAFLVAQVVRRAGPGAVVVDLCCGTGAIGAAIAAAVPGVEVHAADVDPAAVACARRNLPRVYQGDLYAALPERLRGRVDLLVVNAPYVPTAAIATMPPEARDHEPRIALDGGADGLDVQRRVAADAPAWLRPGGALLIETGADQAPRTAAVFAAAGLVPLVEYAEDATVVIGER